MNSEEIGSIVVKYYESLSSPKKSILNKNEWTSFASIVKEENESYQVVSFGSGTKCLGRDDLSTDGSLVSDSHAEVIARRAFLLYLITQMEESLSSDSSKTILKTIKYEKTTFTLKENVKFHFFISHPPCGDASIFPLKSNNEIINKEQCPKCPNTEKESYEEDDVECKRIKLDKIDEQIGRTGAKLPEEIDKTQNVTLIYEDVQKVGECRVKPGRGNPTLSMSCSDKMAKWFLLGLQGSLLGNLIPHPIPISSVTIGAFVPFSEKAMKRALIERISHFSLYQQNDSFEIKRSNKYNLMDFGNKEEMKDKIPSYHSIISWISAGGKREIQIGIEGRKQGVTKKNLGKPNSSLSISRMFLYRKFKILANRCGFEIGNCTSYGEAKKLNHKYLTNWTNAKSELFENWTSKPDDLLHFYARD